MIYLLNFNITYIIIFATCSPFVFSSKCSLFHDYNVFGSCIIHILNMGCAKIKKNNSGIKRLIIQVLNILNMVYTLRSFSLQNAVCFIILMYLVPVLFTFYIFIQQIQVLNILNMVYTLRSFCLQNVVCFIILTYLVPVLFTFYVQGVLKFKKKNNSGAKRLMIYIVMTVKCSLQ